MGKIDRSFYEITYTLDYLNKQHWWHYMLAYDVVVVSLLPYLN